MEQENLLTAEIPAEEETQQNITQGADKPAGVPEKFWNAETGEIRVEALLKSYLALEQKLSSLPGAPKTPEDYQIALNHGLFDSDPEVNKRLHAKGLTADQVQEVYDLAAERMVPMILDLAAEFQADREVERLVTHFGGVDQWQEVSRQLLQFGQKTLPPKVLEGLASSYDGVMALYAMMQGEGGSENPLLDVPADAAASTTEQDLQAMMRDPKYWRDKDPAFVAKVTEGYKALYDQ